MKKKKVKIGNGKVTPATSSYTNIEKVLNTPIRVHPSLIIGYKNEKETKN